MSTGNIIKVNLSDLIACCAPARRSALDFVCEPIEKGRRDDLAEIERLADKVVPGLAKAILAAFDAQRDAVSLKALVEALRTGSVANVLAVLEGAIGAAPAMAGAEAALVSAVGSAGVATAASIARITRVEFTFGVLNPRLITWLQQYSLGLIREINEASKAGVREALIEGMRAGQNPVAVARQVKQVVGLTERQAKAVANFRKELETFHTRRSAKGWGLGATIDRVNSRQVFRPDQDGSPMDGIDERRLRDFRFDARLKAAMETGKPLDPKVVDRMVEAYARKSLRHRSETIARTEAMRTTNMGVQDAWRQAIDAGRVPETQVRRLWIVARDERLCAVCAPVPKLNPKRGVPFGQAFKTPIGPLSLPPAHPNCRCTVSVRLFEASQLQNEGG